MISLKTTRWTWLGLCALFFNHSGCTGRQNVAHDLIVNLPSGVQEKIAVSEALRIHVAAEPPTLDWDKVSDTTSGIFLTNLMEGLVQYDMSSSEAKLISGLALSWESTEHARKWIFHLRPGVVWSDGVPLTGQHVLDGWQRLLSKDTAGGKANYLYGIKNARDFSLGKKVWQDVGVKWLAPDRIVVELEHPMAFFPYLMRSPWTFPVRLDLVAKWGEHWTDPDKLVTLGAYRLKAWEHDKMVVLERNETYYGKKALTRFIVAMILPEMSTALNLFTAAQLDSVHNLPSVELAVLRKRPDYHETPVDWINYYAFDVTGVGVDQVLVRKAIAQAIDRSEVVRILGGGEEPLSGWIPRDVLGYDQDAGLKFDVERARTLWKQATSALNKPLKLTLMFNTNEDHSRVAENVQAQLKRNLGVDIELRNEEWKVYLNTLKSKPPQMMRMGWQLGYPDPDDPMSMMLSFSENNWTRWKNLKYDDLVAKAAGTEEPAQRRELYRQAQKIMLVDDVAVVPLYTAVNHYLLSDRVKGYPANANGIFDFKAVTLTEKPVR